MVQPHIRHNLIANVVGSGWSAVMGLAFIPLYIHFMGVEAYGLVGVYISLQAIFAILDLGLSQTLGREMARLSLSSVGHQQMADTARTLEVIYGVIAVLLGTILAVSSHFIATFWLKPEQLSSESVSNSLMIMALVIALRWPLTLYIGGLNGLQRQVVLNIQLAFFATFQGVGAVLVLWLLKPTIEAFFIWQGISTLLQVLSLRLGFWRTMPVKAGRFSLSVFDGIWRFALSMTGISLLAAVLTQLDKIVLSKMLSLEKFGFYVFAATAASVLIRVVSPVFTAFLPRYTQLVSSGDHEGLRSSYRMGGQIMAIALVPIALVLIFFSKEILLVWTQDEYLVENSYILVAVLILGNMLNGFISVPYAIQLAYGWTRFALVQNFLAVIVVVPTLFYFVGAFGELGAAFVWAGMNFICLVFGVFIMHRRLLPGEGGRWFFESVFLPLGCGGIASLSLFIFFPISGGVVKIVISLAIILFLIGCCVALSLSFIRGVVLVYMRRWWCGFL